MKKCGSMSRIRTSILALIVISGAFLNSSAARLMEKLDRGVVAVNRGSDVFVSWRMMGTEPSSIGFNVYRNGEKINGEPITESTNYVDAGGSTGDSYTVTSVVNGSESQPSGSAGVWGEQYKTIPLNRPANGPQGGSYEPNDLSVGDLDGDGEYELIIKWYPSNAKDNAHSGHTDNTFLEAVKLDGTSLWRIDLGVNIRSGAHYTQFMVYDLDSDGKAEVACKTAPGTRDGSGAYLSRGPAANDNDGADYRNSGGYVLEGPEYLTVFNGETGAEMETVEYIPVRGSVNSWGDNYGNRVDRFLACIAYLDGEHPSLVMCRGYYTRTVLAAWDWDGTSLSHRWTFDSDDGYRSYAGQGAHSLSVGDVDGDGADEIMYGACAIDNDGTGLYSTGYGHGDATHLGDFDPDRPGLEFFMPHEGATWGISYRDAATGEMILDVRDEGDVGRGVAADVHPGHRGAEIWASGHGPFDSKGRSVSMSPSSTNFLVYWDGDVHRELLNDEMIDNVNEQGRTERLLTAYHFGAAKNNGTKSNPGLSADILGDWREEVIWRHADNNALLIFTTTIPTDHKNYTLMHDPIYRLSIAWQNVAYNQPPHVGYYFPDGAPVPDITLVNGEPVEDCAGVMGGGAYVDNCGECVGGTTGREPCGQDCNGDWGGDAYMDDCGMCAGGETGVLPCKGSVQGEDAAEFDGVTESINGGFVGEGYLNTSNEAGASASWVFHADEALTTDLVFRYANGSSADRPVSVSVNGTEQQASVSMPSTSAWTTWNSVSVPISFIQGENVVTLTSLTSEGAANIDMITYSSNALNNQSTSARGDLSGKKSLHLSIVKDRVSFHNPKSSGVTISLFSISGRKVANLFNGQAKKGYNSVGFKDALLVPGVYIVKMDCGTGEKRSVMYTRGK
ncbi:MAG: carbohydrate-binding protein [Chitinispirillaceae bacterium]